MKLQIYKSVFNRRRKIFVSQNSRHLQVWMTSLRWTPALLIRMQPIQFFLRWVNTVFAAILAMVLSFCIQFFCCLQFLFACLSSRRHAFPFSFTWCWPHDFCILYRSFYMCVIAPTNIAFHQWSLRGSYLTSNQFTGHRFLHLTTSRWTHCWVWWATVGEKSRTKGQLSPTFWRFWSK